MGLTTSRKVKFKVTMTKWPVHTEQHNTHSTAEKQQATPRRNRHLDKKYFMCFSDVPIFILILIDDF